MYPIIRMIKEFAIFRNAPKLGNFEAHVSHHRCWPQDIDVFMEMNNGRILTILDLGRTLLGHRTGLMGVLKENGWGMTMAGVSVRYRRRIRPFTKFRMVSRGLGWDDKFMYLDQTIWIGDQCAVQALYRAAITGPDGIVPPVKISESLGREIVSPPLPDWVNNWVDADATRIWPPEVDGRSGA